MGLQLKNFDMAGNRPQLSYMSTNIYQSKTGAIFSIFFLLISFFIVAFKILHVSQKQQISVTEEIQKNSTYAPLYLNNSHFRLALVIQDEEGYRGRTIKYSQQSKYGINLTAAEYYAVYTPQKTQYYMNVVKLVPCESTDDEFCLPPDLQVRVIGNLEVDNPEHTGQIYRRYAFQVRKCRIDVDPSCQDFTFRISYYFIFNATSISPNNPDINNVHCYNSTQRVFQTHPILDPSKTQSLVLYFRNITFVTDEAIIPDFIYAYFGINKNFVVNQTWYYDEEKQKEVYETDGTMLQIYLKKSLYSITYYRKYVKFDQIAGQVLGLLALTSGILFFLYSGYNEWSFFQRKLKQTGHPHINPSLCSYYCYILRKCKCIPCFNSSVRHSYQTQQYLMLFDSFDIGKLSERVKLLEEKQIQKISLKQKEEESMNLFEEKAESRHEIEESLLDSGSIHQNLLSSSEIKGRASQFGEEQDENIN